MTLPPPTRRSRAAVLVDGSPASALCAVIAARNAPAPLLVHVSEVHEEQPVWWLAGLAEQLGAEVVVVRGDPAGPVGALLEAAMPTVARHGIGRVVVATTEPLAPAAVGAAAVADVEVRAPLTGASSERVIAECLRVGAPLRWTSSCTARGTSSFEPCGRCDGCVARSAAFASYGALDPLLVAQRLPAIPLGRDPELVLLVGMPFSGSTLLSLLLGAHPEVFAAGEVRDLGDDVRDGVLCACGSRLDACAQWGSVVCRADVGALTSQPGEPPDAAAVAELLRRAGRRFATPVVLDSTKDPAWCAAMLDAAVGPATPRVLHLVRDGRAAITSFRTRAHLPHDAATVTRRWCDTHDAAAALGARVGPDRYLQVRYEDLVAAGPDGTADPAPVLRRIVDWLGLDPAPLPSMLDHLGAQSHQVRGNPMRFDRRPVAVDERWRTQLDAPDLATFSALAGPRAARWGYGGRLG